MMNLGTRVAIGSSFYLGDIGDNAPMPLLTHSLYMNKVEDT